MNRESKNAARWTLAGMIPVLCVGTAMLTGRSVGAQDKPADPPPAKEQAAVRLTADRIRTERKAIVTEYMNLTPEEAAKFWPIYDAYQQDLSVPQKRLGDLVLKFNQAYGGVTDQDAEKFLEDYLNAEKNILDRKRTYVGRFQKALPTKKVLRLYQLENRMDATIDYNMAGELPLVKS
jgi:hypothetical protein